MFLLILSNDIVLYYYDWYFFWEAYFNYEIENQGYYKNVRMNSLFYILNSSQVAQNEARQLLFFKRLLNLLLTFTMYHFLHCNTFIFL